MDWEGGNILCLRGVWMAMMASVYDCLPHRMVRCPCVHGFMGCVVREVEREIIIGVRGCGSVDSK
jgi:hypothetical protein